MQKIQRQTVQRAQIPITVTAMKMPMQTPIKKVLIKVIPMRKM